MLYFFLFPDSRFALTGRKEFTTLLLTFKNVVIVELSQVKKIIYHRRSITLSWKPNFEMNGASPPLTLVRFYFNAISLVDMTILKFKCTFFVKTDRDNNFFLGSWYALFLWKPIWFQILCFLRYYITLSPYTPYSNQNNTQIF